MRKCSVHSQAQVTGSSCMLTSFDSNQIKMCPRIPLAAALLPGAINNLRVAEGGLLTELLGSLLGISHQNKRPALVMVPSKWLTMASQVSAQNHSCSSLIQSSPIQVLQLKKEYFNRQRSKTMSGPK